MAALRSLSSSEVDLSAPRLGRRGGRDRRRVSTPMRALGLMPGRMVAGFSSLLARGIAWLTEPFRPPARRQILLDIPLRYRCSLHGEYGSVTAEAGASGEPHATAYTKRGGCPVAVTVGANSPGNHSPHHRRMVAPERTNQTWPQTSADGMDSGATIRRTDPWGPDDVTMIPLRAVFRRPIHPDDRETRPWPSWST